MAIEKVAPQVVSDIEFYVSNNGSECGVSVVGLALLCGVSQGGMSDLTNGVNTGIGKVSPKPLETLRGKVFSLSLAGNNGAKIVNSKAAARIIRYYAYESKAANDVAKASYDKFAEMGIDTWIKQVTGYQSKDAISLVNQQVLAAMQQLIAEVQEAKVIAKEYNDIRQVTVTLYPGLDSMLDQLPGVKALPSCKDMVTAKEWLALKGIGLTHDRMCAFGRLVADTFKSLTGQVPNDKLAKVGTKWVRVGKGYAEEHYPILETAWKQFAA